VYVIVAISGNDTTQEKQGHARVCINCNPNTTETNSSISSSDTKWNP